MKVKAIWEFDVDVEGLDPEQIDIPGIAKDVTRTELIYLLRKQELIADDFEYIVDEPVKYSELSPINANMQNCLYTIQDANSNPDAAKLLESLVKKHFALLGHLAETSLYDVLEYEKRFANSCIEPMRILAWDNEKLKKEVNKLRRELGKIEKYKENDDETT